MLACVSDNHYYRDKSAALDPRGSQMGYDSTFIVTFFSIYTKYLQEEGKC